VRTGILLRLGQNETGVIMVGYLSHADRGASSETIALVVEVSGGLAASYENKE
jgi:hypothetical protein